MDKTEIMKSLNMSREDVFYTALSLACTHNILEECICAGLEQLEKSVIKKLSDFYLDTDILKMFFNEFAISGNHYYRCLSRKIYRIIRGVSQSELATMAGLKQSHISSYESGNEYRRKAEEAYDLIGYKDFERRCTE